jgi:hypothetical protein
MVRVSQPCCHGRGEPVSLVRPDPVVPDGIERPFSPFGPLGISASLLLGSKHTGKHLLLIEGAMAEPASVIAKVALFISIGTAAFSIYQWWNTQREDRIKNAIEISKSYYKDVDTLTQRAVMLAYKGQKVSPQQILLIGQMTDQMEYIALLTNHGKLDQDFLSQDIQCAMLFVLGAHAQLKTTFPPLEEVKLREINKFAPHAQCAIKTTVDQAVTPPQSN